MPARTIVVPLAVAVCALAPACVPRPVIAPRVVVDACRAAIHDVPIRWLAPSARRDRAGLDAWCADVGPIYATVQPSRSVNEPFDSIAVITWNVHGGTGNVPQVIARLRAGELTAGVPVRAFVLLLQETYRRRGAIETTRSRRTAPRSVTRTSEDDAHEIATLSNTLATAVVYAPAMRNGPRGEDRGNAVLSNLPLDDVTVVELPFERQRRVAVMASVGGTTAGTRWRLRVVSTHFDTGLMWNRGGADVARGRQARALIDVLASSDWPVVVGADLNAEWRDGEPATRAIAKTLPDARQPNEPTWSGPLGLRRHLDYLFARVPHGPLVVSRVADRLGSDHHALVAIVPLRALTVEDSTSAAGASISFAHTLSER